MRLLVIDGQGGGIGRALVERILARWPQADLAAVGTNAIATTAMLKAGVRKAATGENAVRVSARGADVILGPIGIIVADSMMGEISPAMAQAVGAADARKILIPSAKCSAYIAGTGGQGVQALIDDAMEALSAHMRAEM
ncbi:MAG: DUF3842 family protein [Clostridiales bacterium]|nr:DUF3842 family protein [Clostridiales bacterium]